MKMHNHCAIFAPDGTYGQPDQITRTFRPEQKWHSDWLVHFINHEPLYIDEVCKAHRQSKKKTRSSCQTSMGLVFVNMFYAGLDAQVRHGHLVGQEG